MQKKHVTTVVATIHINNKGQFSINLLDGTDLYIGWSRGMDAGTHLYFEGAITWLNKCGYHQSLAKEKNTSLITSTRPS